MLDLLLKRYRPDDLPKAGDIRKPSDNDCMAQVLIYSTCTEEVQATHLIDCSFARQILNNLEDAFKP